MYITDIINITRTTPKSSTLSNPPPEICIQNFSTAD